MSALRGDGRGVERISKYGRRGGGSETRKAEATGVKATGRGGAGATGEGAGYGTPVDDVVHMGEIGVDFEEGFVFWGEGRGFVETCSFSYPVLFLLWGGRGSGDGVWRGVWIERGHVGVDGELRGVWCEGGEGGHAVIDGVGGGEL